MRSWQNGCCCMWPSTGFRDVVEIWDPDCAKQMVTNTACKWLCNDTTIHLAACQSRGSDTTMADYAFTRRAVLRTASRFCTIVPENLLPRASCREESALASGRFRQVSWTACLSSNIFAFVSTDSVHAARSMTSIRFMSLA